MMVRWLVIFSLSLGAHAQNSDPKAKLKLSEHNCVSPCKIKLDASQSEPVKGKSISKYIFNLGNGETIESSTPVIDYMYINYKESSDPKKTKYQKIKKYTQWIKEKFKGLERFEITLIVTQNDNKSSKTEKDHLVVKASDILPSIDGNDLVPPKPDQAINDSTLLGIDLDEDGVRDDVELWINNSFKTEQKRKGFKQMAKRMQETFLNINDKNKTKEAIKKELEASDCLVHVYNGDLSVTSQSIKLLEVEFYNTKDRLTAEDKVSMHWKGADIKDYDPFARADRDKCDF